MESSEVVRRVELGRATVREFMAVTRGDPGLCFFGFCETVVVGGIMDLSMDELPVVLGAVAAEIQRFGEEIGKSIRMAQMLGDIDTHLEMGGGDDG